MKIMINDYEVEIKARYIHNERASKYDTMAVLNQISIWAFEASERDKMLGLNAISSNAKEANDQIYNTLKGKGFYE